MKHFSSIPESPFVLRYCLHLSVTPALRMRLTESKSRCYQYLFLLVDLVWAGNAATDSGNPWCRILSIHICSRISGDSAHAETLVLCWDIMQLCGLCHRTRNISYYSSGLRSCKLGVFDILSCHRCLGGQLLIVSI